MICCLGTPGAVDTRPLANTTDCQCSQSVQVNQCSCSDRWGRSGIECRHNNAHPNQHNPPCKKSDVWPYKCGELCNR